MLALERRRTFRNYTIATWSRPTPKSNEHGNEKYQTDINFKSYISPKINFYRARARERDDNKVSERSTKTSDENRLSLIMSRVEARSMRRLIM